MATAHFITARVDHVQGDQAYYNKAQDRVMLPDPSQFPTSTGYSHTALHELGHATGHESRLNRPTMMKHEGFGSQSYAREELRAEMAAMIAGEQLGVGHEPRHGTAYVASWIKALENDPREIRFAAVDAQKAADWMVERARTIEKHPPRDVDREPVRVIDGRGPDVPPPPRPCEHRSQHRRRGKRNGTRLGRLVNGRRNRPGGQQPVPAVRNRSQGRSRAEARVEPREAP